MTRNHLMFFHAEPSAPGFVESDFEDEKPYVFEFSMDDSPLDQDDPECALRNYYAAPYKRTVGSI